MKVRIVSYEDVHSWILGKFALKLQEELKKLSVDVDISDTPDSTAHINHHIMYTGYDGRQNSIDTTMITHVDSIQKYTRIKQQLHSAQMGVCMSQETRDKLVDSGIPRERLCYINPAHDNVIKPRKFIVGITSRTYEDGRKRDETLIGIAERVSPNWVSFKIMGKGWDRIVGVVRGRGFDVEYYDKFDYDIYVKMVPTFDYYLYYSFDEGSMGFLDALTAGVPTIVTAQGYHLDAEGGITYPIDGKAETIARVLNDAIDRRSLLVRSVAGWTWEQYAIKHLEMWTGLLGKRSTSHLPVIGKNREDVRPKTIVSRMNGYLYIAKLLSQSIVAALKRRIDSTFGRPKGEK